MAGYEFTGKKPFKNVYYTGIVRDKQRRKMSKSLGNSPDPLALIAEHGADAVRLGMLLCSPAGNDILFDESQIQQGRNFCNKIWNAYRLVNGWEAEEKQLTNYESQSIQWINGRIENVIHENEGHFDQFRLSSALMNLYKLIWDDFCSVYLEGVKPPYGEKISIQALDSSKEVFSKLMKAIHPFLPFISEEIYQGLNGNTEFCIVSAYPKRNTEHLSLDFEIPVTLVGEIRNIRAQKQLSPKETLKIQIINPVKELEEFSEMIAKLGNVEITKSVEGNQIISLPIKTSEVLVELNIELDKEEERKRIQTEIDYNRGFLKSVSAKLGNERFVQNAKPEIVERERQKLTDAESKLSALEESLKALG